MSLFSKKPTQTSSSAPLYTIGSQNTVLLVGLGNVGKEYDGTRHNVGFYALDSFVKAHDECGGWVTKKDLKCDLSTGQFGDTRVIAIKPATFMNNSGEAVQAVQHFYKLSPEHTTVIYDELDVPFGSIRMRKGGGSAGHNGIKSIIAHTHDNFNRVRVGVANEHSAEADSASFVLASFNTSEKSHLTSLAKEVDSIITEGIYGGDLTAETRSFLS